MSSDLVKFQNIGDTAVKAEVDLKASPEKVYAAWTQRANFLKWFGPRSGSLEVDRFDCSVGGRYDVTMVFDDGDRAQIVGTYQELVPAEKIVFTWQWMEGSELSNETLVTVELVPSETGTHLTLTHERFLSTGTRDGHQQGWVSLLSKLVSSVEN